MNEIMKFNFDGKNIRTMLIENEPWFVGKDVARTLGYSNPRKALIDHVDEEDKGVTKCDTLGGKQDISIINESGLYALIFGSKLPTAKKFKRWITSEVLPALRKNGSYSINNQNDEVVKNMIDLSNNLLIMTKSTTEICQYLATVIKEVSMDKKDYLSRNESKTSQVTDFNYSKCKLDQFPQEIKDVVDEMMEEMRNQESLNFSLIARYCVVHGYPISSPSVKKYYEQHFKEQ